ncbi:MAG: conjugative transposon protein TraM [Rikenellaceae bacterium]
MDKIKRKRIENFIIYPLIVLTVFLITWSSLSNSKEGEKLGSNGFNATVPEAMQEEMANDKQDAYEKESINKDSEQREVIKTLADNMIEQKVKVELTPSQDKEISSSEKPTAQQRVEASTEAYRQMNKTLGNFYDTPIEDDEKQQLKAEINELKQQLEINQQLQPAMGIDDQITLIEKSYELAAKYNMPNEKDTKTINSLNDDNAVKTESSSVKYEDTNSNSIGVVKQSVVSNISNPLSDKDFVVAYSKPRNLGFNTAIGGSLDDERNTISAIVNFNQTVMDGQTLQLRITEKMSVGDRILPKNAIVIGSCKIQGERLYINISTIEYKGYIMPVNIVVMDNNGLEGIFIPNLSEVNAIKEVAANLGSSMGTTINLNQQSAGGQILTDVGKGAIQGASQYVNKKMREVKVHLKSGYQVMLYKGTSKF